MYFISVKADDFDKYFIDYIDGDILKSISSLSEVVNYSFVSNSCISIQEVRSSFDSWCKVLSYFYRLDIILSQKSIKAYVHESKWAISIHTTFGDVRDSD